MRPTWPIALLTLALLAGCGSTAAPAAGPATSGGVPTSAGQTAGGGSSRLQCPAETDVARTLGITVTRADDPIRNSTTVVACSYGGKRADGGGTGVMVRLQVGDAQREYNALKATTAAQGYPVTDMSGLGDEAFTYVVAKVDLHGLSARKGDFTVYVTSQSSFEQEAALVNLIFAR